MRSADGELDRVAQSMFPRGSGEQFEGVAGHRAIMPRALDGVFERAMLLHRRQREFKIAIANLALFQRPAPEFPLVAPPTPERQHHRQGDLALAEIIADILAELGRRAAIIERVVD